MNPIPNRICVTTGEQHTVQKTIDDFFDETREFIKETYGIQGGYEMHFEKKFGELAFRPDVVTNNRITYLSYRDLVLATVFETRTEFNHVMYTFFRNLEGIEELMW